MNDNKRTLASFINENYNQNQKQQGLDSMGPSYTTRLALFGINLVHRFPDLSNLNAIDVNEIEKVADFTEVCSVIAQETWSKITQLRDKRQVQQGERRVA